MNGEYHEIGCAPYVWKPDHPGISCHAVRAMLQFYTYFLRNTSAKEQQSVPPIHRILIIYQSLGCVISCCCCFFILKGNCFLWPIQGTCNSGYDDVFSNLVSVNKLLIIYFSSLSRFRPSSSASVGASSASEPVFIFPSLE
jgi:hypothetical protein